MKLKMDFVTNSSSTSFTMVGDCFETYDLMENKKLMEIIMKDCYVDDLNDKDEIYECFRESIHELPGVDVYSFEDTFYLGLDIDKMKDEETLKQFKERAKEVLKNLGIDNVNVDIITETISEY